MKNAKKEFLAHIEGKEVKFVKIKYDYSFGKGLNFEFAGDACEAAEMLDFEYDSGYGVQHLYGVIWYKDGTWSERCEYDGLEWWEHNSCPSLDIDFEDLP